MFEIKKVKSCPVTRGTTGVVVMEPEVVGEIAGAMREQKGIEWAVLLLGSRHREGRLVRVTGLRVPRQSRTVAAVEIPEMECGEEVVGVLHSHHSMGAFFSGTDEMRLNPRFGLSIVVAEPGGKDRAGERAMLLGFDYLAEARVGLPCGRLGVVGMRLVVEEPSALIVEEETDWLVTGDDRQGGCEEEVEFEKALGYVLARCGMVEARYVPGTAIYGLGTGMISEGLERETFEEQGPEPLKASLTGWMDRREVGWTDWDWHEWAAGKDELRVETSHSGGYVEDSLGWWLDEVEKEWRDWLRTERTSRQDWFDPGYGDWVRFLVDYAIEAEDELLDEPGVAR